MFWNIVLFLMLLLGIGSVVCDVLFMTSHKFKSTKLGQINMYTKTVKNLSNWFDEQYKDFDIYHKEKIVPVGSARAMGAMGEEGLGRKKPTRVTKDGRVLSDKEVYVIEEDVVEQVQVSQENKGIKDIISEGKMLSIDEHEATVGLNKTILDYRDINDKEGIIEDYEVLLVEYAKSSDFLIKAVFIIVVLLMLLVSSGDALF